MVLSTWISKKTRSAALPLAAGVFLGFAVRGAHAAGPEPYRVGPGDVLAIDVWQEADLRGNYLVTGRGLIQFPLLGEVGVASKTLPEIKAALTAALSKDYLVHPVVNVSVSVYQSHKVFVFGHVTRPGLYYLREDPSFLKLLLEAGGPASAGVSSASILRFHEVPAQGGSPLEHLRVDLNALFTGGDLSQDVPLQASDIVFVSRPGSGPELLASGNQVYVLGEVKNPGTYTWKEGYTALNAILDAGGLTEFAAANRARLVRGQDGNRKVETLKLGDVVEGQLEKNVPLKPGDLINIPESYF